MFIWYYVWWCQAKGCANETRRKPIVPYYDCVNLVQFISCWVRIGILSDNFFQMHFCMFFTFSRSLYDKSLVCDVILIMPFECIDPLCGHINCLFTLFHRMFWVFYVRNIVGTSYFTDRELVQCVIYVWNVTDKQSTALHQTLFLIDILYVFLPYYSRKKIRMDIPLSVTIGFPVQ